MDIHIVGDNVYGIFHESETIDRNIWEVLCVKRNRIVIAAKKDLKENKE